MNIKILLSIAVMGILAAIISVIVYNENIKTLPPVAFSHNPYEAGIYATGIIESYQPHGSNVNIYPEVSGRVIQVYVKEGDAIKNNNPIFAIDATVQQKIVEKDAALMKLAYASLINVKEQYDKIHRSYLLDKKSISQNTLDNAINAVNMAQYNWIAAKAQYQSDQALLEKYMVRSSINGSVLRVTTAVGDYVSPLGSFDTYTQAMLPSVQMGIVTPYLQVRCYVDEILTPKLPRSDHLMATLFIRGLENKSIPLEFVGIQPFTIPNIELSDERNERVDVRVLPILFKFKKPTDIQIFPGQLVDVYIKGKK